MKTIIQIALDFVDSSRALKLAEESLKGGADWLEAGTPLIKAEGLAVIRQLRQKFPKIKIVADMKTMDAGRTEVEIAAKAGANIIAVLGGAHDETIRECIEASKNYGAEIMGDLLQVENIVQRAVELEKMGVNYIGLHIPIDEQMKGKISFNFITKIKQAVNVPVAIAGGINSENVVEAVESGADIIIVGGAVTKSKNAEESVRQIKKAIQEKKSLKSEFFTRVGAENIRKILLQTSTANISDALHRGAPLKGLLPITPGVKMLGEAFTVRTYPGDWAKPVQAIDAAREEDVIVIDSGGVGPAVWGELATNSAIKKKISGVVIDGAIRDVADIRKMNFPAFAKIITPQAGEPKGFGEMNVSVTISGQKVFPGDWIIGDDDGVIVIPRASAVEITNRSMDVLEKENRIREE
ncbi:MAG: 3-hexulose-6-phosphate synthase, partial [Elusimicrobiota bacterium]